LLKRCLSVETEGQAMLVMLWSYREGPPTKRTQRGASRRRWYGVPVSLQVLWLTFWLLDCFLVVCRTLGELSRHWTTLCQEDLNSSLSLGWFPCLLCSLPADAPTIEAEGRSKLAHMSAHSYQHAPSIRVRALRHASSPT
jgi:hypothetical protein